MLDTTLTVCTTPRIVPAPGLWADAFDRPVDSMAQTRNLCGVFMEEATASLLGGTRLKTDGRFDVCPDVILTPTRFAESKCVGKTGSAIIYSHRLAKDRDWIVGGKELWFCFWHHKAKMADAKFNSDVPRLLAESIRSVYVIPLALLTTLCNKPEKILNKKATTLNGGKLGYASNGYGIGWSIRLSEVAKHCLTHRSHVVRAGGQEFQVPALYAHPCEVV